MAPPQKRQKLDPPPQNVPSQSTLRDAYGNELLSSFDGSGISNPGGAFHARDVTINNIASPQPPAAHDNRQVLLESLRFDQIDARHDSIERAHAKTCRWFLGTDAYKQWEGKGLSHANNFLWIKGKPGAGKSTLMKFLHGQFRTRTRRKNSKEILISFFFNARGSDLEKSTIGLYRSLLWQLLDKNPSLQQVLDEFRPGYQWTDERLKSLLEEVIQELGETPIFCLIDALDECDQDQIRRMVSFLEALVDMQSSLHVCFASRHYPHITVQSSHEIILEERDGHEQDISTYLSSALRIKPNHLAEQIRSEMQQKAHGVFMWVVLVVDILNKEFDSGRKYRLRERLNELPGDLHLLFRDILTRDTNNQANLLLCIQWVLFAKEPLTPRQLHLAILSGTEPEFLPHCHSEPYLEDDVQRYILDNSKGLAQTTKSKVPTVQFIHESVRDFLLKGNGLGELFSGLQSNIHGESHEVLKDCCLAYMTMKPLMELESSSSSEAIQAFPFLEYAHHGVLFHGNEAALHGIGQDSFIADFPRSEWVKQHNILEKSQVRRYTTTVTLLYILAEAGLPDLIRAHSKRQSCFDFEPERYGVPILAALALKHEPTVQVMLELQAERIPEFDFPDFRERLESVETKPQSLSRAFKFRQSRKVVEQLLEHGDERILLFFLETTDYDSWSPGLNLSALFSVACRYRRFESARFLAEVGSSTLTAGRIKSPLLIALEHGAVEAAKILISRGADSNARDGWNWTPLHYAAKSNHLEIAKLLIDCGADISAARATGDTPLHHALWEGHLQLAQLLLDHGANVSAFNYSRSTPLHYACSKSRTELARQLIERGASVVATNRNGETPLHEACQVYILHRDTVETVELLLENKADASAATDDGETPLHQLLSNVGYGESEDIRLEIAKILVNSGADVSCPDKNGRTPLQRASSKVHWQGIADFFQSRVPVPSSPAALHRFEEPWQLRLPSNQP